MTTLAAMFKAAYGRQVLEDLLPVLVFCDCLDEHGYSADNLRKYIEIGEQWDINSELRNIAYNLSLGRY